MSKVAKATLGLMMVTMLSKILGFAREMVLTYTYGAGMVADSYITAMSIPGVLFTTIGSAIGTTLIPLYFEIKNSQDEVKSKEFLNNVLNIVLIISILISLLGFIFAKSLVKVFAIGFVGQKLELTITFTKIIIFGIIFIGLSSLMKGWLQINDKFAISGIVGLPYNIIIIISIVISSITDVKLLAIGGLLAVCSQFLIQLPFAIRSGYTYKFKININDVYIKKMLVMILPVFIGVGVNQLNTIVDKSLASTLGDGIPTVLNSANRLNGFVMAMFVTTIAAVIYPKLAKGFNENNMEKFAALITKYVNCIIILILPISIGAIVLATPVVRIVFERGKFDSSDTYLTAIALIFYSIGMIGFSLREILGRVFYSLQDTKTPMKNGAVAMIMNIILNIILVQYMGHAGIAFATSISSIVCIILLFKSLQKKIGYFGQDKILKTSIKVFLASITMGLTTHLSYKLLCTYVTKGFIGDIMTLLASILIGGIVYGVIIIVLKIDEVNSIIYNVRKKLKINRVIIDK